MKTNRCIVMAATLWMPLAHFPVFAGESVPQAPESGKPPAAELTASDWIQLPTLPSRIPVVPVTVNGTKGCLMVDTGAIDSSLRIDVAEKLGVTLEKSGTSAIGISGHTKMMFGEVDVKLAYDEKGTFPPVSGSWSFMTLPGGDGPPGVGELLGIFGLRELAKLGALIDCGSGRIMFGGDGKTPPPSDMQTIQMDAIKFGKEGLFTWAVPVKIGETEGMMIVDTAAQHSVIEMEFAAKAGVELVDSNVVSHGAGGKAEAMKKSILKGMIVAGEVELGGMQLGAVDMPSFRKTCERQYEGRKPFAGILGMDQLRRMKARFHTLSGRLDAREKALEPDLDSIFGPDPALVIQALIALAKSGDAEAKEMLRVARENQGRITLEREDKVRMIRRAMEKGLLK
jgi:predicted aspartyl protease